MQVRLCNPQYILCPNSLYKAWVTLDIVGTKAQILHLQQETRYPILGDKPQREAPDQVLFCTVQFFF
jgi:hypothetical protein